MKKTTAWIATSLALSSPTFAEEIPELKFNNLLQFWVLNDLTGSSAPLNFRLRRAELQVSQQLTPELKWLMMVDAAKYLKAGAISASNDNKILQDFVLSYQLCPGLEFRAGQFKVPTFSEFISPTNDLVLPERSALSRVQGDRREPAV